MPMSLPFPQSKHRTKKLQKLYVKQLEFILKQYDAELGKVINERDAYRAQAVNLRKDCQRADILAAKYKSERDLMCVKSAGFRV